MILMLLSQNEIKEPWSYKRRWVGGIFKRVDGKIDPQDKKFFHIYIRLISLSVFPNLKTFSSRMSL